MKLLALDLASSTGFAIGDPEGLNPECGSVRFAKPNAPHGAIAASCAEWIRSRLIQWEPDLIVYEAPIAPSLMRGATNIGTTMILLGLPFIVMGAAYKAGILIQSARVSDVRRFFLGSNMKSRTAKQLTLRRCERFGWKPADDDAADAAALWSYQASLVAPHLAHKLTPLFGGAQL